jgi:hypothetical protein
MRGDGMKGLEGGVIENLDLTVAGGEEEFFSGPGKRCLVRLGGLAVN